VVAAAIVDTLDSLDLEYPTVSEDKLKELAVAKRTLLGNKGTEHAPSAEE
jgi:hypothetical protein